MANDGFVTARPPKGGAKRRVPVHYLKEPFNFQIPPSAKAGGTADAEVALVREPATPNTTKKEARP